MGFLLGLALLLGVLSIIMEEKSLQDDEWVQNRNESEVDIMKEADDTVDVMLVGDSLIYTSISPLQMYNDYGITAFDLCESQQQIQESCAIMETAFYAQHPKVVILSASTLFLDDRGKNDFDIWMMERIFKAIPIVQYHDMWKPVLAKSYWVEEETYKGFIFRDIAVPYTGGEYMKAESAEEFSKYLASKKRRKPKLNPIAENNLKHLKDMCDENGAKLILIATPSPADWNSHKNLAVYEFAAANQIEFYDLNLQLDEVGINWQYDSFDGGEHLNLLGAQKVTRYVEQEILKMPCDEESGADDASENSNTYNLKDHRNQPGFEEWDKISKEYGEKEKEVWNRLVQ